MTSFGSTRESRWGLRYSLLRRHDERLVGTVMVKLGDVPNGRSPFEVAVQWCRNVRPECDPIMPRVVVLDGVDVARPVREPVAVATA